MRSNQCNIFRSSCSVERILSTTHCPRGWVSKPLACIKKWWGKDIEHWPIRAICGAPHSANDLPYSTPLHFPTFSFPLVSLLLLICLLTTVLLIQKFLENMVPMLLYWYVSMVIKLLVYKLSKFMLLFLQYIFMFYASLISWKASQSTTVASALDVSYV